jgi:hypothetical protein
VVWSILKTTGFSQSGRERSHGDDEVHWIVRLKPIQGWNIQDLLQMPLSLDIW